VPEPPGTLVRQLRTALRVRHYSGRTEEAYVAWARRYVRFHGLRHPRELEAEARERFLSWLAVRGQVSASTQNQARSALVFLYRTVLERDAQVPDVGALAAGLGDVVRAKLPTTLPTVLTRAEVRTVLAALDGTPRLIALVLYGAGVRLLEALQLRVKDVDLAQHQLTVRAGKGAKDRVTMLPEAAAAPLARHLARARALHARDLARGAGIVALPGALARKYPNAAGEWCWQWVFPAARPYRDATAGAVRRHH
jgi:integron integrase